MTDALEDREGSVSIKFGGKTITNLGFVDDIDALAGKEELFKSVKQLDNINNIWHGDQCTKD